ncbi:MAM domain-containing glycosylphosphatidylinositol anchor protein 2-like [Cyprinus carpio]|uniref:MAM domain-containing glycosylphosphatidylinositol anchor protein 2-like n=1 Tax=Cyprinus carpio TaxID=7962 RepID=A0A9Q9YZM3_CYPCA|nr:MAM domain-containing glycosylphosphatidylinositol anchor protein 2-like [Cyprinus carpio]
MEGWNVKPVEEAAAPFSSDLEGEQEVSDGHNSQEEVTTDRNPGLQRKRFNETLRITRIQRHQGGRYYCKAENGLGTPAIKSIRVDVYYLDDPIVTVHQSIGEAKEQFYYERTVFLRCAANSNPPVRYSWRRGREFLSQGSDKGVEIYEPFFTPGKTLAQMYCIHCSNVIWSRHHSYVTCSCARIVVAEKCL